MSEINIKNKYIRTSRGYIGSVDNERLSKNQFQFHLDSNEGDIVDEHCISVVKDPIKWNGYNEIVKGYGPTNNIFKLLMTGDIVVIEYFDGVAKVCDTAIVKRKDDENNIVLYFDTARDQLFRYSDNRLEYVRKLNLLKNNDLYITVGPVKINPKIIRILTTENIFKRGYKL